MGLTNLKKNDIMQCKLYELFFTVNFVFEKDVNIYYLYYLVDIIFITLVPKVYG